MNPGAPTTDWKNALRTLVVELLNHYRRVVLVLDEFPYMIDKIRKEEGCESARHVLDVLREIRQEVSGLRLVLCGSIGLHHVLRDLRDGSWAPINDLAPLSIGPLGNECAEALATALLRNEAIDCGGSEASVGAEIAVATEGIPFFIHGVAASLKKLRPRRPIVAADVHQAVSNATENENDPWGLRHMEQRVYDYYPEKSLTAFEVLDQIAANGSLTFQDLRCLPACQDSDEREFRNLIDDLQRDNYLRHADGRFVFRLELLRRTWLSIRYIESAP